MTVTVLLFASYADALGTSAIELEKTLTVRIISEWVLFGPSAMKLLKAVANSVELEEAFSI